MLTVRPSYRRGPVFLGLLGRFDEHARRHGYTRLLISGLVERIAIYEKLGFRALGPAVACGRAAFVPMSLDLRRLPASLRRMIAWWEARLAGESGVAGRQPAPSSPGRSGYRRGSGKRGAGRRSRIEATVSSPGSRTHVAGLADGRGGPRVALFFGSGTLANDVVAATLASDRTAGAGLILVNGEFGRGSRVRPCGSA